MSLMTDAEIANVVRAMPGFRNAVVTDDALEICRAIESIAHERGRQQGLAEAVEICRQESEWRGSAIDCCVHIKAHAAKGAK